jgi:uncharacterized protein involved in outer membrane biogenesis
MKKFLKIFGIVFLVILVILIVTPFFLKKPIERIAKEQLNKSLNAKVDFSTVKLSFIRNFPNVYVGLEDFIIVGIGDFEKDTLISFKSFSVTVDVVSAIKMTNIKVKSILLDDPRVFAHVLKNGKANWDIAKPSEEVTPEDTATSGSFDFGANLKKFEISNGYIKYQDDTGKMSAVINGLDFELSGDFSVKQSDMQITSTIAALDFLMDDIRYLRNTKVGFDAKIGADLEKGIYTFKENEIKLNELTMGFDGMVKMPGDTIETDIKFKTKKADFKTVLSMVPAVYMKDFASVQTAGVLKLDGFVKGIYYGNRMPNVGLTLLVEKAMFRYPDLPKSVENINLDVNLYYDGSQMDNSTVDINKFHFETVGNPFDMELHIKTPISDMAVDGKFIGKIDLNSVKDIVYLDSTTLKGIIESNVDIKGSMSMIEQNKYEDFKAAGSLKLTDFEYVSPMVPWGLKILTCVMEFSPKYVALTQFDSRVGRSDFQLSGNIEKFIPYVFNNGTITGNLTLNSKLIDANEFLPQEEVAQTQEVVDTTQLTVFEVPDKIDFTMKSNIGQINYDKLKITDITGIVIVRDRKAILQNLNMNLLEGSMKMSGEYNTQDMKNPLFDFDFNMNNIDIPSSYTAFNTVAKLAPVAQNCKGKISADLSLTSFLDPHMMPVYSSMTGGGRLKSQSIEVGNSNTFVKIADALKNDKFRKLNMKDVDITFNIKNGRVYVDPFETNMGVGKMIIGGDQGIDQTLNYLVKLVMPRSELGGASQLLDGLTNNAVAKGLNIQAGENVNIDATVSGTVLKPEVKLNLAGSAKNAMQDMKAQMKETVTAKVTEVKQDAKQKAKAEADKIIKEAEIKSQQLKDAAAVAAENTRKEANALAAKTESEASNPLAKVAAKKMAEKIRKEGNNKANKIEEKANAQSDSIMNKARAQAAKLD